jgi:hypothetical protein
MSLLTATDQPPGPLLEQLSAHAPDTHTARVRRVSHEEFQQTLRRAGFGLGAGLTFKYDARRDETVWTLDGEPIGLTVGRIGATSACYLLA